MDFLKKILFLNVFLSTSLLFSQETLKTRLPVKVVSLTYGTYEEYGEYLGTVKGSFEANLLSYLGGRIEKINFKTGEKIKKGTLLCSIDGERIANDLNSARLQFEIAQTNYERLKRHKKH